MIVAVFPLTVQTPRDVYVPGDDSMMVPLKFLYQGVMGTSGSPRIMRRTLAATSAGSYDGTLVDHPVPMPSLPLISRVGRTGTYHSGSTESPSSSRYRSRGSSSGWKSRLVAGASLVKMYRADAASFPPLARVPNWPDGIR